MPEYGLIAKVTRIPRPHPLETMVDFRLQIARRPKTLPTNRIFIPLTPTQFESARKFHEQRQEAALTLREKTRDEFGFLRVKLHPDKKAIEWESFYPFGKSVPSGVKEPRRKGIGTEVQLAVSQWLAEKYPDHQIFHQGVSLDRQPHLAAMGISQFMHHPLAKYLELVKSYRNKRATAGKVS